MEVYRSSSSSDRDPEKRTRGLRERSGLTKMVSISSLLNPILPPPPSPSSSSLLPLSPSLSPFSVPTSLSTFSQASDQSCSLDSSRKFRHINYLARPLLPPTSSPHHQQQQQQQQQNNHLRHPHAASSSLSPAVPTSARFSTPVSNIITNVSSKVRGPVRYPPFETFSSPSVVSHLAEFNIQPSPNQGQIAANPRHIPYNSEKKGFFEKTGRESFEVFQYTFQLPASFFPRSNTDDLPLPPQTTHTLMWDYTTSLLRITPLFKALSYSKTTPSKMLTLNPGLREITHSITGGALTAQGYWMPWLAAREVAKTFCWRIRWALVPVFGEAFAHECTQVGGEGWGVMRIDPEVVRACTEESEALRAWAKGERRVESVEGFWNLGLGGVGEMMREKVQEEKEQRSAKKKAVRSTRYAESGYGTDTELEEDGMGEISPRARLVKQLAQWDGPQHGAEGGGRAERKSPMVLDNWSVIGDKNGNEEERKRMDAATGLVKLRSGWVQFAGDEEGKGDAERVAIASPEHSHGHAETPRGEKRKAEDDTDEEQDEEDGEEVEGESETADEEDDQQVTATETEVKLSHNMARRLSKEAKAAYLLMQLQVADQIWAEREAKADKDAHRDKRRRASSW